MMTKKKTPFSSSHSTRPANGAPLRGNESPTVVAMTKASAVATASWRGRDGSAVPHQQGVGRESHAHMGSDPCVRGKNLNKNQKHICPPEGTEGCKNLYMQ